MADLACPDTYSPLTYLDKTGRTLRQFFQEQPSENFRAGQTVFWEGDDASSIVQVVQGVLRLYRILPDGHRAITGFVFPGEVRGVAFHQTCLYTAEAITDARIRRYSCTRLRRCAAEDPVLRQDIAAAISDEFLQAHEQIVVLGCKSAEERVASFLLMIARRTGSFASSPVEIGVPMTRLDMADCLGLTIETVCRVVAKLKRLDLVSFKGRNLAILHAPAALANFAGEDVLDGCLDAPALAS
ncbi:Crp/Fnr family transcriptional regulator [Microvirga sp. 2MCAF38]|uniref:Crp/Fnr family transcriptional regulator n=1 Tax=Microvirga sp. 2MCAF38 TaxID=3232989 RepID=UPI003F95F3C7